MYAVIHTGGKQYRVQPGDIVQIEKLEGEVGNPVSFERVLLVAKPNGEQAPQVWLGKPELSGARVSGEIVGQGRGDKILIIKMKRRKQYRRTQGHRQFLTQVLVTEVATGAGESAKLSDSDKKSRLAGFQSHLAAKGQAFTKPKWLLGDESDDSSEGSNDGSVAEVSATKNAPKAASKKRAVAPRKAAK